MTSFRSIKDKSRGIEPTPAPLIASGNPNVFKEAADRKKGGKVKRTTGKSVGAMTGSAVKARADRPQRRAGGGRLYDRFLQSDWGKKFNDWQNAPERYSWLGGPGTNAKFQQWQAGRNPLQGFGLGAAQMPQQQPAPAAAPAPVAANPMAGVGGAPQFGGRKRGGRTKQRDSVREAGGIHPRSTYDHGG